MKRLATRVATGLVAGCGLFLAGPVPVGFATPFVDGSAGVQLYYQADPGVRNDIVLAAEPGRWVLTDHAVAQIDIRGNAGCARGSAPNVVTCPSLGLPVEADAWWVIRGDDDDDRLQIDDSVPDRADLSALIMLYGGDGSDVLTAHKNDGAYLSGGRDGDTLIGGAGADVLSGDPGDDVIKGGLSADSVFGGEGKDSFSYGAEGRVRGVRAVLDGVTPSGSEDADGVGDKLSEIENLSGTPFGDVLIGDASNNLLRGLGGSDQISGLGGNDSLFSSGTSGTSWLDGGDGDDRIQTKNSLLDTLTCGAGVDTANVDGIDVVAAFGGCETRTS